VQDYASPQSRHNKTLATFRLAELRKCQGDIAEGSDRYGHDAVSCRESFPKFRRNVGPSSVRSSSPKDPSKRRELLTERHAVTSL